MKQQQKWSDDQFETCLQDKILPYPFHSLYRSIWIDCVNFQFYCSGYQCCQISEIGRRFGALLKENPANPWSCTLGTTTWTASRMPWWSSTIPVAGRRKNTHSLAHTPPHAIWFSGWVEFVGAKNKIHLMFKYGDNVFLFFSLWNIHKTMWV